MHLIDAASHRMANGAYEVFILMEYCAGGGIIDMMNRRLRERLTEAEILQIFVDVCEGVATMHYQRPPLLHRDLKVSHAHLCRVASLKRSAGREHPTGIGDFVQTLRFRVISRGSSSTSHSSGDSRP